MVFPREIENQRSPKIFLTCATFSYFQRLIRQTTSRTHPGKQRWLVQSCFSFFYPLFAGNSREFALCAPLLPEDDAQTAAPVFRECDPRDFDFRG
jgi:hypothetical protein